ncbi:MAG: hypothetical protein ACRYFS_13155 [Janthinobacterium lividum]
MKIDDRLSFLYKEIDNPIDKIDGRTKAKIKICLGFCFVSSVIGMIAGWKIGEQKGVAALSPDAWAGDGVGVFIASCDGASQGISVGFGIGLVCFLAYRMWMSMRLNHRSA